MATPAYPDRALRQEMETEDIDAIVAVSPENFQHLAGVFIVSQRTIRERLAFVVYPRLGSPFLLVSSVERRDSVRMQSWTGDILTYTEYAVLPIQGLAQALKERKLNMGRIWLELGYLSGRDTDLLRRELPLLEIVDAENVLDRSRMIKTPTQIEHMTQISRLWEEAVLDAFKGIRPGDSERVIANRMIRNLLDRGADWVPYASFASGPERTLMIFSMPNETPVQRGDIMRMDMVGFFRDYHI